MGKAERVVLDTNVLISAALRREGQPRAVINAVRKQRGVLLFSDDTFDELQTRLRLPKFDRYVSPDERAIYPAQLEAVSDGFRSLARNSGAGIPMTTSCWRRR